MSDNQIWVVVSGEYSDYRVHCAAPTEQQARELADALPSKSYTEYSIEPLPFGTIGELSAKRMWNYSIRDHLPPSKYTADNSEGGGKNGFIATFIGRTPITADAHGETESRVCDWGGSVECHITGVSDRSFEHAKKIAHDLHAKWKAERLLDPTPRTPEQIAQEVSA